jgi:hypothetical protein
MADACLSIISILLVVAAVVISIIINVFCAVGGSDGSAPERVLASNRH